jgi:Na+/pantothenate symporter
MRSVLLVEEASYIEAVSFIDGGNQLYRGGQFYWWRKPVISRRSVLLMEEASYIEAVSFIDGGSQLYRGCQFYW